MIFGVSFSDANTGFIAGGDNGVGSNVLRTNDGAKTFTSIPIHEPAMMFMAVATTNQESAIVTGLGILSGANQYLINSSFTNSSEPGVSVQQTQDAQIINGVEGAYAVTGQFTFFSSKEPINGVALSYDNGATFTFSSVGSNPNIPARYASFPSSTVGFVAGGTWPTSKKSYGKYLTRNIHLHHNREEKESYMHIEFDHDDEAGEDGVPPYNGTWAASIFRSVDGFQTWEEVYQNDTFYFNQIACPSENVCFAAAENDDFGYGFRTTDGMGRTDNE